MQCNSSHMGVFFGKYFIPYFFCIYIKCLNPLWLVQLHSQYIDRQLYSVTVSVTVTQQRVVGGTVFLPRLTVVSAFMSAPAHRH